MDFDLVSQPQPIKDFFYTTKDFLNVVRTAKKRSLDIVEKKIILQTKILELKMITNDLTAHVHLPSENLAQAIFYSLPLYNDILNELILYKGDADLIWKDTYALMNELICILANIKSKGNLWNYQATANLLVKILVGLPKYDAPPIYPLPNDHNLVNKYLADLNSIASTSGVYTNVILALDSIPREELCKWSTSAFWHFKLQFEMYDEAYPGFTSFFARNDLYQFTQIIYNIMIYHQTLDPVRLLALNLESKFSNIWDISIQTFGVLPKKSLTGIILLIERLQKNIENSLEIIFTHHTYGMLPTNYNLNQDNNVIYMTNLKKFYTYNICYLQFLITAFSYTKAKPIMQYKKQLAEFLEKSNDYNMVLETSAGGKENIFNSNIKNDYMALITQRIEILALYAKLEHSVELLNSNLKELQWLITAKNYELFPEFYLKYYLALLTVDIECSVAYNLEEILRNLLELRENLTSRPRDYIAVCILLALLDYTATKNTNKLERFLDDAKRKGISEGGQFHLEEKFNQYCNYLRNMLQPRNDPNKQALKNKDNSIATFFFSEEVIPIDSMTWLIPKFRKLSSNNKEEVLLYIPFNRAKDAMI